MPGDVERTVSVSMETEELRKGPNLNIAELIDMKVRVGADGEYLKQVQ